MSGPPWHAASVAETAARLGTDAASGLPAVEAARRLAVHGPNELERDPAPSAGRILLAQLASPLVLLLLGAAALSAAIGEAADTAVILAIVALNAAIGFRQEYRAERAMAALRALAAPVVRVVRDGATTTVPAREVVPGDLVLLEAGARVPADARLVEAHALRADEAPLTGESEPADKHVAPVAAATPLADRDSLVFGGTAVTAGRGAGVVVATGMATELGQVAGLLRRTADSSTPLQERLERLVGRLALAAAAIVAIVVALGFARGEDTETVLLTGVSLAVAAVPEGLPAVVTITLALGAQRMLRRNALIRRLYAVETLGSVTTICTDKTGTLTQNRMTVTTLDPLGGSDAVLLACASLCTDTTESGGELLGDPTETALVRAAAERGLPKAALEAALPRVGELPFAAERGRMTTVHALPAGTGALPAALRAALGRLAAADGRLSITKGAPERVVPRCTGVLGSDGPRPLDTAGRERVLAASGALAGAGERVLAVALRRWPGEPGTDPGTLETGLTLLGLVGMADPPRPEARAAVATCRAAGIRPLMITGDHPRTALAIARELGIATSEARALTGADLERVEARELAEAAAATSVYARVAPAQKLRLVEALAARGETVAMTGDGVNDAPALRRADIGVAMGVTGTDVAKEAADMVLLDDDFATVVRAVREGRVVFDNVRTFVRYVLTANAAEVAIMIAGPLLGMPLPLLPLQILWINLVTDGPPALALAVERGEPGAMARPPTPRAASALGGDGGRRILLRGLVLAALLLGAGWALWDSGAAAWQTFVFTGLVFAEALAAFALRSERRPLWRIPLRENPALAGAVALVLALQVALVHVPLLQDAFDTDPLTPGQWVLVLAAAAAFVALVELDKHRRRASADRRILQA